MPYADPLTDAEIVSALARLPGWTRDGPLLRRTVDVRDFRAAIALVNAVADAAEATNHHPDISITRYKRVSFELTTHAAGAVTRRDVQLATEIDRLATTAR
ncbi:MAG: 4a-hydroxytetrahydrobiopterin dehydratase [Chloroflexi bacterium]|nr:4a-hydroxytetrahydrobiopterin dehydratase [Chloroflexota bacterium]